MAEHACIYEDDVVAAVVSRRWDGANGELTQHAAACEICREVAAVAELLASDQERARYEARVPAAGQVWWRAAVRARLDAAHAAARPMTWLHGIAAACAVGLACAFVGVAWSSLRDVGGWLLTQMPKADAGIGDLASAVSAMLQNSLPLAFVVAACIILAPIAVVLALSDGSR